MNLKQHITTLCICIVGIMPVYAQRTIHMTDYGIKPDTQADCSPKLQKALLSIKALLAADEPVTLVFAPGEYHFHAPKAATRTYYISNHDQPNPKKVAMPLEDMQHVTIEGSGSAFVFHGHITPIALVRSANCTLQNFTVDYADPRNPQIRVVKNMGAQGITFKPEPWVRYKIKNNRFVAYDKTWSIKPVTGIAFEPKTRHIVYQTSDIDFNSEGVIQLKDGTLHAPHFKNEKLVTGTVVALRTYDRPSPALFLSECTNTRIYNVKVHYADGMGLLAQLCTDITLDAFGVCLKGDQDPRYFTAQADATHFSQCRGKIHSVNGLYEAMMDDAINVHGVYLKITKKIDSHTVIGSYMHSQAYGFDWGYVGDSVQFIRSQTMDHIGTNRITAIERTDADGLDRLKDVKITFANPLPQWDEAHTAVGIENLTWTPEVYFANNTVRNNRARGALFSSPRKTVAENNFFDHTSGTAILLCGDCNGWYESGPCRDVLIRNNTFKNALTNMFQFTNAVISIYPEIPNLQQQQGYYHGGTKDAIRIVDNTFDTFDKPILYAKSVDGLLFKGNKVIENNNYKPFHWNENRFFFERCNGIRIE